MALENLCIMDAKLNIHFLYITPITNYMIVHQFLYGWPPLFLFYIHVTTGTPGLDGRSLFDSCMDCCPCWSSWSCCKVALVGCLGASSASSSLSSPCYKQICRIMVFYFGIKFDLEDKDQGSSMVRFGNITFILHGSKPSWPISRLWYTSNKNEVFSFTHLHASNNAIQQFRLKNKM